MLHRNAALRKRGYRKNPHRQVSNEELVAAALERDGHVTFRLSLEIRDRQLTRRESNGETRGGSRGPYFRWKGDAAIVRLYGRDAYQQFLHDLRDFIMTYADDHPGQAAVHFGKTVFERKPLKVFDRKGSLVGLPPMPKWNGGNE